MTSDLGIAWNMTEKPGAAVAGASIVVAYAVGAAVAWPFTRTPAVSAAPVTVAG